MHTRLFKRFGPVFTMAVASKFYIGNRTQEEQPASQPLPKNASLGSSVEAAKTDDCVWLDHDGQWNPGPRRL